MTSLNDLSRMRLLIEPVDVWLFRDGKPFNADSDHSARGIFPPYASVMQGIIRSHELVVRKVDLGNKHAIEQAVGTGTDFGKLRMQGPYLAKQENGHWVRYFPVPAHAAINANQKYQAIAPSKLEAKTSADDVLPLLLPPHDVKPSKKDFGAWLSEDELMKCLKGGEVCALKNGDFFQFEERTGIGMDHQRRSTQQGLLYEAQFVRMQPNTGLCVDVNGYEKWPSAGLMRMGGEGRGGYFKQDTYKETRPSHAPNTPLPNNFMVYFASPTYFERGWQPQSWQTFFDGKVTLEAVALHKYETIGGFDWAKGQQKSARRFVAAGSCYFFSSAGNAKLSPKLIQNAITEYGAEIGFGQVFIAPWPQTR
jgi:CRISPR-associated protein Cmr3